MKLTVKTPIIEKKESEVLEEGFWGDLISGKSADGAKSGNKEVDAILYKPWNKEGENRLKKIGAPDFVIKKYRKGNYVKSYWDDAGDFWVSTGLIDTPDDMGHLLLDFIGLVPVIGEAADLANAIWYFKQAAEGEGEKRLLLGGLSLLSMIPIVGWAGAALKKAIRYGTPVSAKVALGLIKHIPTFTRVVTDLVSKSTRVQKLLPNGAGPVIGAVKGFLTKAGKKAVPEAIPGAGEKLLSKAAKEAAKESAEMVTKKTGRTFKKAVGAAGDEAYSAAIKAGSKEGLGVGATLASAKAARETAVNVMEREAKNVETYVHSIKYAVSRGNKTVGKGATKKTLGELQADLAEAVFKAGGDYKALNIAIKEAGLKGSAKTFVKGVKELTGPAAKEFLELAAVAEKRGMMVGGKRVANNYWKKYSMRQIKRGGLAVVKYNLLTHQVGGSIFEDDPLSGVKRKATGSKGPSSGKRCSATYLKKRCSGPLVTKLQTRLAQLKYNLGKHGVDSKYGKDTATAVSAFQKASGLEVDGIAGKDTLAALFGSGTAKKAKVDAKLGEDCVYSTDCERGLFCAGSGGRGSREIGKCVSAAAVKKAYAGSGGPAGSKAAKTGGGAASQIKAKADRFIQTYIDRARGKKASDEQIWNIVKNYDKTNAKAINTALEKASYLEESSVNRTLADHKEQVLIERLEKLTKGLV